MSDKLESTTSGQGYGVQSPFPNASNLSGFVTPFADALIKNIPTSGTPTGSLPKP